MLSQIDPDVAAIAAIQSVPTILNVICRTTGMGFAAVARVTDDRWVTCALLDRIDFGLKPGDRLDLETTLCHDVRTRSQPIMIDDVAADPHYRDHSTPALYGFRSYISMPIIRADGRFFGTLCAIDPAPAKVSDPNVVDTFRLFAQLIAANLDAGDHLAEIEAELATERHLAELREQLIAVLGHDLRSPVAAVSAGTSLLLRRDLDEQSRSIVNGMQDSIGRMGDLITNVLDFARLRLGGPFLAARLTPVSVDSHLTSLVDEQRAVHAGREIELRIDVAAPVMLDPGRFAQLVSNLLFNALSHGEPGAPVLVEARNDPYGFELAVTNSGRPIAPELLPELFKPFVRGAITPGRDGLGLGLYIASEIAKAHGGTLTVASAGAETRFVFRMSPDDQSAE